MTRFACVRLSIYINVTLTCAIQPTASMSVDSRCHPTRTRVLPSNLIQLLMIFKRAPNADGNGSEHTMEHSNQSAMRSAPSRTATVTVTSTLRCFAEYEVVATSTSSSSSSSLSRVSVGVIRLTSVQSP